MWGKIVDFAYIVYGKIRRYFHLGNFRKKHIFFRFADDKLQIASVDHHDFVSGVQKKINKLANGSDREKFIKMALIRALDGCNFIIFSVVGESNKFIQFWTGEHELKYNFFANDANRLKNCFLSVIGLLSEMGFVNDSVAEYKGRMTFKIDKGRDYISVDANFRKDLNLATDFVYIVFKQIYKTKGNKLVAKVG
ncbi:MAG TPA: hypothetical protein PKZ92_01985 [Candidatus Woesebacteria bacterium]|nr:hypothetical protein [Candidatus Shapirobacteria bacterium]HOR02007.1 hypothetical protein [Candidatus Woesebacteria bacterium]